MSGSITAGQVKVEGDGPIGTPWTVQLYRLDGSIRNLAAFAKRPDAEKAADRVRNAVLNNETWVHALIDISAGELRHSA